jgi:flagellar protein FlaJ
MLPGFSTLADLPTSISIALVVMCTPPAIVHSKIARRKAEIEKGIANFLRDLTEIRKTGMAPEKCIESLSKRRYGAFSKELEKISSQLSWGIPVKQVFQEFMKRTKSWLSQVVVFLLVEAIDVGGGTIGMMESLTRFNNMTQDVEKEKRMNSRPYIIMPYFAAVMLMATTIMLLMFLGKTVSLANTGMGSQVDLASVSMMFSLSVIVHVFMIGLVAGKIGEESIAAGFKHSALLVVLALVASIVIPKIGIF